MRLCLLLLVLLFLFEALNADTKKKKKNLLDLTERDVQKIYEQWEENDEESDDDDYDDYDPRKPPSGPAIDIEGIQAGKVDPQKIMEQSKKGKPLMIFVGVKDAKDQQYTDQVSRIWMQSLLNAHIPVERYVVAEDRVLFMTRDGSKAWQIKDYLVTLEECTTVNFEHLSFPCKGTAEGAEGYQHPQKSEL